VGFHFTSLRLYLLITWRLNSKLFGLQALLYMFFSQNYLNYVLYSPYSSGNMSLAKIIAPTANIVVDAAFPTNNWKLPIVEVLLISNALFHGFFTLARAKFLNPLAWIAN
jgi:hypothetical protein